MKGRRTLSFEGERIGRTSGFPRPDLSTPYGGVPQAAPSDLLGIIEIGSVFVTPYGKSYVYGYGRAQASDLYLVDGLK